MYWPLQAQGSTGENVRTVQYLLNANGASLTVDGVFGPLTAGATSTFQSTLGLAVDGEVGDATWGALISQIAQGSSGDVVRAVQSQLNSRCGQVTVDGSFGSETLRAVEMFQAPIGLVSDGIVNWYTWHALVNDYLKSTDAGSCIKNVFQAWSNNDQVSAAYNATPQSLATLFGHPWKASDAWVFDACGGALGHIFCIWNRAGGTLRIGGPDPGGGLYIYVDSVTFQ